MLPLLTGYDVLHLHWIRGFLDWSLLSHPKLAATPVILTLHDTSGFTGGCHYTSGCDRFVERCGQCPQLGSTSERDLSRRNWQRKERALAARSGLMHVVGSSQWISGEAERSSLLGTLPITTIYNGVDMEVFQPRDKAFARRLLGIPREAAVVMFSAASLENPRKGFKYLVEAMKEVSCKEQVVLLSAGPGCPVLPGNVRHLGVGMVNNELFMSLVYSAADVFVIPSLEENFALTALEASACGLPVVGFNIGGIPELVEHGQTGFLVSSKDALELRNKVAQLLADPGLGAEMGAKARRRIQKSFTSEIMGNNFRNLYEQLAGRAVQAAPLDSSLHECDRVQASGNVL